MIHQGRVVDLVIQLETWKEKWLPVVRYNYAHGTPHRDLIHADGKKEKEWFEGESLDEIVNRAVDDLKTNWKHYLLRCGYEDETEGQKEK